jgi:murein DD-endopeptidase MepM/ murein hydrolase activator NlpD
MFEFIKKIEGDRIITLWVMKDKTAAPLQYRIKVRSMKIIGAGAACFMILLPLSLVITGARCALLQVKNSKLSRTAARYQVSEDKLKGLADKVAVVEDDFTQSCRRTRQVIAGMEKDLKYWLPDAAVGGGEGGGSDVPEYAAASPLSGTQVDQVNNIQLRIARLDQQIKSYETTVHELDSAWDERNVLFTSFPSIWPVPEGRITSEFGMRIHPISGKYQMHEGLDLAAPSGTPIFAAAPGIVVNAEAVEGYGNAVTIDHGYGLSTYYAHCLRLLVHAGQRVNKGQKIAEVGNTGYSTGPHLHFEVRIRSVPVDPLQYLSVYAPGPLPESGSP